MSNSLSVCYVFRYQAVPQVHCSHPRRLPSGVSVAAHTQTAGGCGQVAVLRTGECVCVCFSVRITSLQLLVPSAEASTDLHLATLRIVVFCADHAAAFAVAFFQSAEAALIPPVPECVNSCRLN